MDERIKFFVGLDTHKDNTSIAACEAGREPSRFVGTIGPDVPTLLKVLAKAGEPASVNVVYEAGPTGYGLQRELSRRGYQCQIVAPSLIPRRAGERVKNDRRDCARLAELSRAGELKAIWIPDEAHEALRNLSPIGRDDLI
jgi:transposase